MGKLNNLANSNTNLGDMLDKVTSKLFSNIGNISNSEENIEFKEPKNPTDPIVVFDPEFGFSNIVMPYNEEDTNENDIYGVNMNILNVNGISVPLIKLNNKVIFKNAIYSLHIELKDFLPHIILTVNDIDGNIQATDVPGMNNVITVILIAPVDGANKKMSIDFYITDCKFNDDNTITYIGDFKFTGLRQKKYTQIGTEKISTYKMLETIAKELKLGFACTKKCEEINDAKWRQIYSKTYVEYIDQELSNAGVDENSIFDAWIDNFGYLVMVNLAYIMTETVDAKQLTTKVIEGATVPLPDDSVPQQEVKEVFRIITNTKTQSTIYNLFFNTYHSNVDNEKIINKGTSNKYFYLSSPCEDNIITTKQLEIIEDSVDGKKDPEEYKYENIEFIGTYQTDEEDGVCAIYQKEIIDNFKNKINAKNLVVVLENANYSLQRGMLINVIIDEYQASNKQSIENNYKNTESEGDDENDIEAPDVSTEIRDIISAERISLINPSLSGIYYIKDMAFDYIYGNDNIKQTLTLIKKGSLNNLTNKYTNPKVH